MACETINVKKVCFIPNDTSLGTVELCQFVKHGVSGLPVWYYALPNNPSSPIDPASFLGGGSIGKCSEDEAEVFVVRLDGNKTGVSVAKIEGDALVAADIGNTFTLSGKYLSYTTQWLGDSEQNAILDWNDISYLAGRGSGSAGYLHASLPSLTDSENLIHDDEIVLTAQADAFVEFRFKRLQ